MTARIYKSNRLFKIPANHPRKGFSWSYEDDKFLKDNYLSMDDDKIGFHLKRTPYAVMQRRYRFGLIKDKKRKPYQQTIALAFRERNLIISTHQKIVKMRSLIAEAENETNNYKKDKIKQQLKKLSGL